jgi:hypothetical protein
MKAEVEAVAAVAAAQVESLQRLRTTEVLLQVEVGQVLLRLMEALMVLGVAASRQALSVGDAQLDGGGRHHMQGAGYRILPLEAAEVNRMMVLDDYTLPHACFE